MQWLLNTLLVMMLSLVSSNSSAQQFESFRNIGQTAGIAAGTVTSVTFTPTSSQVSYFNAAGLSVVYDVQLEPSRVISESLPVFMPSPEFGRSEASMNLEGVSFLTGTLVDSQNPEAAVPAHWFRMTLHDGIWSGAFRIADRIYSIDRSDRDNIVKVRATPSQTRSLRPTRQIKVTALIDDEFVFADSPGDSLGMDSLGHLYALESLHVMEAVTNDSLGLTLRLEQLVYQTSVELSSPSGWLESNAGSFGLEDNFAAFFFLGSDAAEAHTGFNYTVLSKADFEQLSTAHYFGQQLDIEEQDATLQSSIDALNYAHWSQSQSDALLVTLNDSALIQVISSDAPEIEITEPEPPINLIPQNILDSEIVESTDALTNSTDTQQASGNNGILQDDAGDTSNPATESETGGGGKFSPASLLGMLLLLSSQVAGRRRRLASIAKTA